MSEAQRKVVDIRHNEDGSFDIETDDGTVYKNCVLQNYSQPGSSGIIVTESVSFDVSEVQDIFSDKMQRKTIDMVD